MSAPIELFTGDDNKTLEPAYVWWALAILVGLSLEVYSVVLGKPFDIQSYGIGIGGLLVGAGVGKRFGS